MIAANLVTAERVAAAAMVGQFLVLVVAAILAGRQVRGIRAQVDEARELRLAQARPYVVVDFEPEQSPFINLVIANLGKTMARNVRIQVDPPFQSTLDSSAPVPVGKLKLFTESIPSLAPGKRHVTLFDTMIDRKDSDLPGSYRVHLMYEWDGGEPITDEQRLDLDLYRFRMSVTRYTIHHATKELEKIRRRLEDWSARPGLLVLTAEEKRARDEERFRHAREARDQEVADQGEAVADARARRPSRLLRAFVRLAGRR